MLEDLAPGAQEVMVAVIDIAPGATRLGWIGTGVMGGSMCGHLLARGFALTVHSRTRSKAEPLLERGARWADTPQAVAAQSDVVFTLVGFPRDVRQVILGPAGVLAGARPGSIVVDMTTSEPALAVEIAQRAAEQGVASIDAPVSGGDIGAREARLAIMIGGPRDIAESLQPCWEALGRSIVYHGGPGAGQHAKLVNQTLIAGTMIGLCEALLYAHRAGLDATAVLASVSSGAAASWSLAHLAPRILANDFAPGFFVEHFLKDIGLALAEANRMGLALPGLALAQQLYQAVLAHGHGRSGTHALQLALASLSGLDWPSRGAPCPGR
jgi:3-hydroxyisobutyrate dehydrogenase